MLLRRSYARKEPRKLDNTTLTVGSVTYAIKARRLLLHAGIRAKVVKTVSDGTGSGCTHGIVIPSSRFFDAVVILKENGIDYALLGSGGKK